MARYGAEPKGAKPAKDCGVDTAIGSSESSSSGRGHSCLVRLLAPSVAPPNGDADVETASTESCSAGPDILVCLPLPTDALPNGDASFSIRAGPGRSHALRPDRGGTANRLVAHGFLFFSLIPCPKWPMTGPG
jgi:hypothetical protein